MQLSQREAERQERRATNLIWNAARDYSLAPVVRAYDTEVLDSFERTPMGDEFEQLAWIAL